MTEAPVGGRGVLRSNDAARNGAFHRESRSMSPREARALRRRRPAEGGQGPAAEAPRRALRRRRPAAEYLDSSSSSDSGSSSCSSAAGSEDEGEQRHDAATPLCKHAGGPVFGDLDKIQEARRRRAVHRKQCNNFEWIVRRMWRRVPREVILPPEHSVKLFRTSWLAAFSAIIAYQQRQYDCSLLAVIVLCCSLNYWRHPTKGWRRSVDMFWAFGALGFQLIVRSPELLLVGENLAFLLYLAATACGAFCYLAARWFGRRQGRPDRAVVWHMSLHAWGNISNAILYYALRRAKQHEKHFHSWAAVEDFHSWAELNEDGPRYS